MRWRRFGRRRRFTRRPRYFARRPSSYRRRYGSRRRVVVRRGRGRRFRRVRALGCGLPVYSRTKLARFRFQQTYVAGSGTPYVEHFWRCNSAYDPDEGAGGPSTAYFSNMAQYYGAYRVLHSRATFTATSVPDGNASAVIQPFVHGVRVMDSQDGGPVALGGMEEFTKSAHTMFRYSTGIPTRSKMSISWSPRGKGIRPDQNQASTTSGNPGWQWYFTYGLGCLDPAANLANNILVKVDITYTCLFLDQKTIDPDVPP